MKKPLLQFRQYSFSARHLREDEAMAIGAAYRQSLPIAEALRNFLRVIFIVIWIP